MLWQTPHTRNIYTQWSQVCCADHQIPAVIHCYIGAVRERLQVVNVEKVKDSQVEREEVQDAMLTRVRGCARLFE